MQVFSLFFAYQIVYNQIDYKYLQNQQRLEGSMQNNNLLENLNKLFEQSTFMRSEELFKKIVDLSAEKLLTKQNHHQELLKKQLLSHQSRIITDKMHSRIVSIRKFKRINKRVISKKKLRESVIKKISISNKQIHERYEEQKAKNSSKLCFSECILRIFGVPFYPNQEEEKQQSESFDREFQKETKRAPNNLSKNENLKRSSSIYKDQVQKKFKKVHKNFRNYIMNKQKEQKTDDLICPICIEILIEPVSTVCGHTFCYSCLDESLLFTHTCPVCRLNIKGMELIPCNHLNQLIRIKCEGKSMTPEQTETYHHRKRQNEKWRQKRFIDVESIDPFSAIDIDARDTENIWCPAIILNVYYVDERISSVLVHYLQWSDLYNEVIDIKSGRLAPWGCFTKRTDLPRYNLHQENDNLRGTVVNGTQNYQYGIMQPTNNFSLLEHLRDMHDTVNALRLPFFSRPLDFTNQSLPNPFITQNNFDADSFPDQQSSESDSNSRPQQAVNQNEMAQQQQGQESVQQEVPYGLLNSDEVSPDSSPNWLNRNGNNNDRNDHEESQLDDEEEQANAREQREEKSPSENDSGMIVLNRFGDRHNYDDDDEESQQSHRPNQQFRGRMVFRNGVHYLI